MSPNQKAAPWIRPKTASQNSRRRSSLPRASSKRSPPMRKMETPKSIENSERNLSWKKTTVTNSPRMLSALRGYGGVRPGVISSAGGQAKAMALTARMPRIAQPRSMSRVKIRSSGLTGAKVASAVRGDGSISTVAMTFPPVAAGKLGRTRRIVKRKSASVGGRVAHDAQTVADLGLGHEGDERRAQAGPQGVADAQKDGDGQAADAIDQQGRFGRARGLGDAAGLEPARHRHDQGQHGLKAGRQKAAVEHEAPDHAQPGGGAAGQVALAPQQPQAAGHGREADHQHDQPPVHLETGQPVVGRPDDQGDDQRRPQGAGQRGQHDALRFAPPGDALLTRKVFRLFQRREHHRVGAGSGPE